MIHAMRPVIIAANWKMHTVPADAGALAATIAGRIAEPSVTRIICPPFVSLGVVGAALTGTGIEVGAQNIHHEVTGAFTGEVSAPMLVGLADWVILGHSERRRDAGETDALVGTKLRRASEWHLRPILCVGEQLADREAGRQDAVVDGQVRGSLAELIAAGTALDSLVIAYEPVWAIGTGRNARGADAAEMAAVIRVALADLGASDGGERIPVLYGGSVTAANIAEFLAEPSIDGALVGGASLKPDEMAGMVGRAAMTATARAGVAG